LAATPAQHRPRVALRLLTWSPHYFRSDKHDRDAEAERNRRTRRMLADDLLGRYLHPDDDVLDVGCGPGYLAVAVAPHVHAVTAIDVSRGVLACARVLNPAPNLEYLTVEDFRRGGRDVDVVYCVAVAEHLTDEVFARALRDWHTALRPGGRLLIHVVVDNPAWRTEEQWRADRGLVGRAKLRFGLNCFGRSAEQVRRLVVGAGFGEFDLLPIASLVDLDDDVAGQHLVVARRLDVAAASARTPSRGLAVEVPAQAGPAERTGLERLDLEQNGLERADPVPVDADPAH
jgi:SAM-dependent methyltransferase